MTESSTVLMVGWSELAAGMPLWARLMLEPLLCRLKELEGPARRSISDSLSNAERHISSCVACGLLLFCPLLLATPV